MFRFVPQAGTEYADLFTNNFVDLAPGPALLDWDCTDRTYDGHRGHDIDLRSFSEQLAGVPVFAARAGVCVARDDGHFDMQTSFGNAPANYVILDHGDGLETWYWHLRNGSVLPQVGDTVEAGQQIGLVASSGNSTGPHLHFETHRDGLAVEPSAGACRTGDSMWVDQTPIRRDGYPREFGIYAGLFSDIGYAGPPWAYPRSSAGDVTTPRITYWVQGHNLEAGSAWSIRFLRPNGTVAFSSGPFTFSFATQDLRSWWGYWWYDIPEMRQIGGEWTFELSINGSVYVAAPVTTLLTPDSQFNRSPEPILARFDPPEPVKGDVVFCRIDGDLVLDDRDFDVVSYRYRWTVDGTEVRSITSAGRSDAIPASLFGRGGVLRCEVTPTDGQADGPAASVEWTIAGGCPADLAAPFGSLNVFDIQAYIGYYVTQDPSADLAAPFGVFNIFDVQAYIGLYNAGCP